jgi:PleD family two-component response regulator
VPPERASRPEKPLILIVDDTPTNVRVLAEALRKDYRIKVANGGQAALDLIASQGVPDLILLDIMMPTMDGYEVCRRLKEDPATKNVPVVFVTAKADIMDEEIGLKLGAVDYIAKPFHLPIIAARIHNHISLKLKSDLLESLAMLDGLTSIPNRRRFDEALHDEWLRARRAGQTISLIMADIDHFKRYNDHYGHGAGDICLIKVANALTHSV